MVTFFVLKKKFRIRNYLLLTGLHICHFLMERITALEQIVDKENTFSFIGRFCPFSTRDKFCPRRL